MILFFKTPDNIYFAVKSTSKISEKEIGMLSWLFGDAILMVEKTISGYFIGPRKEMITPWSTNAVEITQNMGIQGIERIEEFFVAEGKEASFDPMLQNLYTNLNQEIFNIEKTPESIIYIDDIKAYNEQEGLALSDDEIAYLEEISKKSGRKLTDSEIFGFSQVNSEHCRHKIFNGTFIIDGEEKKSSLFQLIKKTTSKNPNRVVSAYKDNCAFMQGPVIEQFAPATQDKPDFFVVSDYESVISLKAETHNFPTTVEPFNGAATGTGGEIRDRVAGGKGAFPLAGTAVYMTAYPRTDNDREWEKAYEPREWLYQTPDEILIKASNGASDFGNKFGQPLICGSVLTFEHAEKDKIFGFDKVIMLAGGVGSGKKKDSLKDKPEINDKIIVMGGDNYRIGMGGGAVSSVATGEYQNIIELNAVQRSNPEMQKRICNAIRAMAEDNNNPIVSIHDHGAGGHLNCLSELVEEEGGEIDMNKLPVGDSTLSAKEIIGNESQERMGLILKEKDIEWLKKVSDRERAPMYVVGNITGDKKFAFVDKEKNLRPMDLKLEFMFGKPPKTILKDELKQNTFEEIKYDSSKIKEYIELVLQLENVACKDWLTNKVDRSVTGKVALQQTAGEIQLPLNNLAIVALDYKGAKGVATAIGHAPVPGLIDPVAGSVLSIAEALTNIAWAPLDGGLKNVSLSANWMWPAKNKGEDARLYRAVEAASNFALELGINIPTGKDSLSMTQKYKEGSVVYAPGTVIISAAAEVTDIRKAVTPVLKHVDDSEIIYIGATKGNFEIGGSAFAQVLNKLGTKTTTIEDARYFATVFNTLQLLIADEKILAGHDVSAGGLITCLLEMNFPNTSRGMAINLTPFNTEDTVKLLMSEQPGFVIQCESQSGVKEILENAGIAYLVLGKPQHERTLQVKNNQTELSLDINMLRDTWYRSSYLLDKKQSTTRLATERFKNYKNQRIEFNFPKSFNGTAASLKINPGRRDKSGIKAAIIREKGVNGDREMAYSLYYAGFDVKDVHMTDLISGRETLEDINMIVFVGGFSNSDVLGSAKGWAGAFIYNEKAKKALDNFYAREDTLSLGICNGCQLMVHLDLIFPTHQEKPMMMVNESGKFESSFLNVTIETNHSVMLRSLSGSRLGIWVAHGEGKFYLPYAKDRYHIPMKYSYDSYPGNPNGSDFATAAICSEDGRHLAMMPHLERAIFPWNWAYYPSERKKDEVSPWIEAFVNAREWLKKNNKQ